MAFAFAHRNTVKRYIYRTSDPSWLGDLMPESGALTSTTRAFGMVRVLNVQDFLQRYPYAVKKLGPIVIGLSDEFMPANSGSWRLAIEGGRVAVERADAEPQVQMTGQQLVKGSFGVRSFEKLTWLGQVHGDPQKIAELSRVFSAGQTLFFDYI